ncbi:MAG: endonuclease, partial [Thiohalospira sp.]
LVAWYRAAGGHEALARWSTDDLRRALLGVNGVGPETADDIVLYAFHRPVFVIDAYTRRIFQRLGLSPARGDGYEDWRAAFEAELFDPDDPAASVALYNEYHALIVALGKDICRPRPRCGDCALATGCPGIEQ